jgi:hypothetical protein
VVFETKRRRTRVSHEHVNQTGAEKRIRLAGVRLRQALFTRVRTPHNARRTVAAIVLEPGLSRSVVDEWVRFETPPDRNRTASNSRTRRLYRTYPQRLWSEDCTSVRRLLREMQELGYTGYYSRVAAFVSSWRVRWDEQPAPNLSCFLAFCGPARTVMV